MIPGAKIFFILGGIYLVGGAAMIVVFFIANWNG